MADNFAFKRRRLTEDLGNDGSGYIRHAPSTPSLTQSFTSSFIDDTCPSLPDSSWAELDNALLGGVVDFGDFLEVPDVDIGDLESNSNCRGSHLNLEHWASVAFSDDRGMPASHPTNGATAVTLTEAGMESQTTGTIPEHVCYGLIHRAAARPVGEMSSQFRRLNDPQVPKVLGHPVLLVQQGGEADVWLCFNDETRFAQLNSQLSSILPAVLGIPGVQMQALVDLIWFRQIIDRAKKASDAIVRVGINVFGPQEAAEKVGKVLSTAKIFLQQPDHIPPGIQYDNPHVLRLDGVYDHPITYAKLDGDDDSDDNEAPTSPPKEDLSTAVNHIYSKLQRGANLRKMKAGASLRTELLPHQQEALDFMTQREDGPISSQFLLWQPDDLAEGVAPCYRHRVTGGLSQEQPSETGGGILADAMGLGKTLSILALVAETRNAAEKWSCETQSTETQRVDSTKPRSKATLVLVSSWLLLNHWMDEISKHLNGTFDVVRYHGQRRDRSPASISSSDIVITTYHTLATEMANAGSPLCGLTWYRIVLDEAHIIRHRQTTFYDSCMQLSSLNRWCVSGTPIQNTLDDIGALFSFIKIHPVDNITTFRTFVTLPFDGRQEKRNLASERLSLLLDSLCLRRTRSVIDFPQQIDVPRFLHLAPEELEQYRQTKSMMNRAIQQRYGPVNQKNVFGLFQAQLQLRLLCNHGTFQNPFSWTTHRNVMNERESALDLFGHGREVRCACCTQPLPVAITNSTYSSSTTCRHVCCLECLEQSVESAEEVSGIQISRCPVCDSQNISSKLKRRPEAASGLQLSSDYFRTEGISTKMAALLADVADDLMASKSIVFSCWTRTLDLVERHFNAYSIPFKRIDGSSPLQSRQKILDDFSQNEQSTVLLMTTGTGAFGLNIPAANRVFIVEPQWNPHTERQAIARAMRLGQQHSLRVYRYVINQTVEQEMLSQQERKLHIAEVGW